MVDNVTTTEQMLQKASGGQYRPVSLEEAFNEFSDKGGTLITGITGVTGIIAVLGILGGTILAVVGMLFGIDKVKGAGIGAIFMGFLALFLAGSLWYWVGATMSVIPN
ncbi:hypothetical protein [Heliorestis convoluta]|uniref:hypothetical protein n=1 Tax=Heliorestis convoluta TaxID=356322 RepID=UPI001389B6A0|nr:hypothetical protein [Heliorestis convoluta]